MERLEDKRISSWKRSGTSTITVVLLALAFGFSTNAWAEGRNDNDNRDFDRDRRDDRDHGRGPNGAGGKRDIEVATFNLYVGGQFDSVLTLDPTDPDFSSKLIAGVSAIHGQILQSNFPVRADALAQQIVRRDPDLVSLQEVSLIRRQSPGDLVIGGSVPATEVELDYLDILLAALERHGGHYAVASQVQDTDVEVPLFTGASFDDVRLTDRDVILVRTDLPPGQLRISNPQGRNFSVALPLPIGVYALRGWCSIDVESRGRSFRVINTHLEEALTLGLPNIQLAQAYELLSDPANTTLPVILSGDFNSDAYGYYSPETYALLTGTAAGQGRFSDAWKVAEPRRLGLTWGHDPLLSDVTFPFTYRLDLILYRGRGLEASDADVIDPIIGHQAPRWFSDHGGVAAAIAIH